MQMGRLVSLRIAEYRLGVSRWSLYEWIRLPAIKLGAQYRVRESDIECLKGEFKQDGKRRRYLELTCREAGQLGGLECLRRRGRIHFARAGKLGQETLTRRYTTDDRRRWGRLGGRPPLKVRYAGEKGNPRRGGMGSPPGH